MGRPLLVAGTAGSEVVVVVHDFQILYPRQPVPGSGESNVSSFLIPAAIGGVPICVPYSFRQDADIAASRAGKKSVTSLIYMRKVENRPGWRAPTDQKVARSNRAGRTF